MKSVGYFLIFMLLFGCKNSEEQKEKTSNNTSPILKIPLPMDSFASLPRLFSTGKGLILSWVEEDSINKLQFSKYNGKKWTSPETIQEGNDWFVNWADFPQIAENNGYFLSSYLKKSDSGTYTYDIKLNHFSQENQHWKKDYLLHSDGVKSEHGFVSMQPYGEKDFFVSWLDGRNIQESHGHGDHGSGAMTLRGAFVDSTGALYRERELDNRVCDCCNTASTITPEGVVVAYRDRSEEEIRDIAILRLSQTEHIEPKIVGNDNWKIAGCPVNGPAVDSFESTLAVAWFTAAKEEPKVQLIFSSDNGNTFGLPLRMDSGNATGRVDLTLLNNEEAVVCWMEPKGDEELIRIRKVSIDGDMGRILTVSKTTSSRASGFPQMELLGDTLYFAWTLNMQGLSEIRMASVSLKAL